MIEVPDPQRWELVRKIFGDALDRDPEDWARYLRRACADDRELRTEVESLLEAHQAGREFLCSPVVDEPGAAVPELRDDGLEGRRLGAYRIERCIGRGGMGRVYSAVRDDSAFEKRVAIKLLKRSMDNAEIIRRFHAERQILAGLEHPNIARLMDGGTTNSGRPYLVMEHVEGLPVDAYCDRHNLRIPDRLELFRKICAAVQFAHRNLVVHRDLKPSNILVTADGEPKLLDFGIAKILDPELSSPALAPTETLLRVMTPDFASPEQILGTPVTTASDVYALGVLLYVLLTGHHPLKLKSRSPVEILWAIRNQDPEPPSHVVGRPLPVPDRSSLDVPSRSINTSRTPDPRRLRRRLVGDLDNIVLMALRKEPERRYSSVDQLSEDLHRHLTGRPILAATDSLRYRCGKFVHRHRLGVLTAAAFIAAVFGFGILMAVQRSEIASERDRLDEQRQKTETQRLRAERVTSFLIDLFEVSDPFSSKVDARNVTARELLDRGAGRLARLKAEPEARADLSHTIGVIYRRIGLSDEAKPLLDYALAARQAAPASDPAKVADSLDQQGLLRQDFGDYAGARKLFLEALAMRRRLFGEQHPATADSLSHLASLAWAIGNFDHAERLQREALDIYQQKLGLENVAVAGSLHWLALILQSQGDHDGAEHAYRETLTIQRRLFGDEHLEVAATQANLAQLFLRRGDVGRAEPLYRQALATLRHRFGNDHVQVAFCVRSLAAVLAAKGESQAAEELYREALALLRRLRGPIHPDLGTALDGLAGVRLANGDYREAERAYREALDIRRNALGEGSPYLAISLTGLGRVAIEKGDYATAEGWLSQALEIGRRAFPQGHWRINVAESLLGDCRLRSGRYAEAEPLLLESYKGLRSRRGDHAVTTLRALDLVIELYEKWDRPEEAERFRMKPEITPKNIIAVSN